MKGQQQDPQDLSAWPRSHGHGPSCIAHPGNGGGAGLRSILGCHPFTLGFREPNRPFVSCSGGAGDQFQDENAQQALPFEHGHK